jgi:hypothetical protein
MGVNLCAYIHKHIYISAMVERKMCAKLDGIHTYMLAYNKKTYTHTCAYDNRERRKATCSGVVGREIVAYIHTRMVTGCDSKPPVRKLWWEEKGKGGKTSITPEAKAKSEVVNTQPSASKAPRELSALLSSASATKSSSKFKVRRYAHVSACGVCVCVCV